MQQVHAPAWRANWINGWLAAIGVIVICEDVQLSWTTDPTPTPIFHLADNIRLVEHIASRIPDPKLVTRSAAQHVAKQNATEDEYERGAAAARENGDWLWSALFTDLGPKNSRDDRSTCFDKSRFYPGMPGTAPISKRLSDLAKSHWGDAAAIERSMAGTLPRSQGNGLAFDPHRLLDPANPLTDVYIDPVIEAVAFHALIILPVRGNGRRTTTRGETGRPPTFRWRTWQQPLDLAGIDAILDQRASEPDRSFKLVDYRKKSTSEATSAYFSEFDT